MSERLKSQLAALLPAPAKPKTPSARELLRTLIECADIEGFTRQGMARVVLDLPPEVLDALCEFEADERERDEDLKDLRA